MRITDLSSIFRHFVQAQIVDNIPKKQRKIILYFIFEWDKGKIHVKWVEEEQNINRKNILPCTD